MMKYFTRRLFIFLFFMPVLPGFFSCSSNKGEKKEGNGNHYAKGFSLVDHGLFKRVEIINPWEKAENIRYEYILARKDAVLHDSLRNRKVIRTPVSNVICTSTSHIAFLEAIGETSAISGVSGGHYMTNAVVRDALEKGTIIDIGYGQNLNYELIIKTKPDLVLVYGIGSEVSGFVNKLNDLGIGVMVVAEYLESTPLGKTEWIRLFAALFDKAEMAEEFFGEIEADYIDLKTRIRNQDTGPTVMVGIPYRDTWWVPGGDSYIANLISDAGGIYPGRKNRSHESFVISFEDALIWAQKADIWINIGMLNSKRELLDADPRFENFRVFNEGIIFNNNRRVSASGGNDFWESGTVYPNRILADLITIFHPGLLFGRNLIYYIEIE